MKRVMKRALADRAKLDCPPQGSAGAAASPPVDAAILNSVASSSSSHQNGRIGYASSPPEGQPLSKLQRVASEEHSPSAAREATPAAHAPPPVPLSRTLPVVKEELSASASVRNMTTVPPSPRSSRTVALQLENSRSNHTTPAASSHKRPRREASASHAHQPEQETDGTSAFYLQHQNRQLAIELKSLQDQVRELTQEREYRRKSCLQAVQALHSLQATWTSLETVLGQEPPPVQSTLVPSSPSMTSSTPGNTDETAVEWTIALHRALQALGTRKRAAFSEDADELDGVDSNGGSEKEMMNLGEMAANITGRAHCLKDWIWQILRSKTLDGVMTTKLMEQERGDNGVQSKTNAELEDELKRLRAQVDELILCRDDLNLKERRLRRNIYRLDVGMITQKQLIQSVAANIDNLDEDPERSEVQKEAVFRGVIRATEDTCATSAVKSSENDESSVSTKVVLDIQRELEDSRREVASREKTIEEMESRLRELEIRVNELCVKQQSDDYREKLESYESMAYKVIAAEKEVNDMAKQLETTREKWAQSAGNEKALTKALEELQEKHQKRWAELAALEETVQSNGEVAPAEEQARKVIELEHKLRQALENVRQAETVRSNLRDALILNESLQATVAELKNKQSEKLEKGERSSSRSENNATPSSSKSDTHGDSRSHSESKGHHHRDRESSGGSDRISAEKAEKIYRENKRMRKELAASNASKEGYKAKLDRVEKERNGLVEVNARLLKQASEKDEMNAKSLSSILHLKSLTEQLTLERDNLEQQLKSAEQLALAARLATNAKERLQEDLAREKTKLEEELHELEKRHAEVKKDLSEKSSECADVNGKTASLRADLSNATKRCDEFVATVEEQKRESRKLLDALEKAERQAKEAREKLAELAKSSEGVAGNSGSGFTTDQLKTQIQHLKNRLACPVCHYRDKECIIMRCRHMHCKQCVEERLANRSRRCPTCNNPFGRNDMEDIFLG